MTREEIIMWKPSAVKASKEHVEGFHELCESGAAAMDGALWLTNIEEIMDLAVEALDKRDAVKKQEIVNDTADTNSFHAGGTGYGAYQTRE